MTQEKALDRMNAARIGPHITCPASRHAQIMAEAMIRGELYAMMDEDRAYCGETIAVVVAALWEARAALAATRTDTPPGAAG